MTKNKIKIIIGVFLILVHFGAILSVFLMDNLEFIESVNIALLLAPLFSVYTVAVVKAFLAGAPWRGGRPESFGYIFASFFFPVAFAIAVFSILFQFGKKIETAEELQIGLGAAETCIGVFLGFVIDTVFREHDPKKLRE